MGAGDPDPERQLPGGFSQGSGGLRLGGDPFATDDFGEQLQGFGGGERVELARQYLAISLLPGFPWLDRIPR